MTGRLQSISQTVALWIIAVIAALFFLRATSQLIPIVIGVLVSYAREPVVAWLKRHRIQRTAGASLVMLVILGASAWGVYSLRNNIASAIEAPPEAARRAPEMVVSKSGSGPGASFQRAAQELQGNQQAKPEGGSSGSSGGQQQQSRPDDGPAAAPSAGAAPQGMFGVLQRGAGSIFALAGQLAVIVFLVFFLLSGHQVRNRVVVEIAGPDRERQRLAASIMDEVNGQILTLPPRPARDRGCRGRRDVGRAGLDGRAERRSLGCPCGPVQLNPVLRPGARPAGCWLSGSCKTAA